MGALKVDFHFLFFRQKKLLWDMIGYNKLISKVNWTSVDVFEVEIHLYNSTELQKYLLHLQRTVTPPVLSTSTVGSNLIINRWSRWAISIWTACGNGDLLLPSVEECVRFRDFIDRGGGGLKHIIFILSTL